MTRVARELLMRPAAYDERLRFEDVSDDGGTLLVRFRWRKNLITFGMRFPFPDDPPTSTWTGLPVESPSDWVHDIGFLIMEETATGFISRATRIRKDGYVELTGPQKEQPTDFYVTGMDLTLGLRWRRIPWTMPVRRFLSDESLLIWLKAETNDVHTRFLGQAVVLWEPDAPQTAKLAFIETAAGAPAEVFDELARAAAEVAADHGAARVRIEPSQWRGPVVEDLLEHYGVAPLPRDV